MGDPGVVLLSGGLDSAVVLSLVNRCRDSIYALSFKLKGQNKKELQCAKELAKHYEVEEHKIIEAPINQLTESHEGNGAYTPARNLVFLSYGAGYAESVGAETIYIAPIDNDYEDFPDCRREFISQFNSVLEEGLKSKVKVDTPLIELNKKQVVKEGLRLNTPLEKTWSCYHEGEEPCGYCQSCKQRKEAFEPLPVDDPLVT